MIQKQTLPINFAQGLDTKTDPWQVAPGNFLRLENQVFTKGNRLTKRNGYKKISTIINSNTGLPDPNVTHLTTFNENLAAIGSNIHSFNAPNAKWVASANPYQSLELSTLPIFRNNINQTQCDAAVSPNGLVCTVFTQDDGVAPTYFYTVCDVATGQNVLPATPQIELPFEAGSPRVFVLGNYFVIVGTDLATSTYNLQYIAVSTVNPGDPLHSAQNIATNYTPSDRLSWDGVVVGSRLFIAYNTASGGQAIKFTYLTNTAAAAGSGPVSAVTFSEYAASIMSVCADTTTATNPIIYATFFDDGASNAFCIAVDNDLNTALIPTRTLQNATVLNIASAAQNGQCQAFYEIENSFTYDSAIAVNFIVTTIIEPRTAPVTFDSVFSNTDPTITASSATGLVDGMFLVDVTTPANIDQPTTFTVSGTTLTLSVPAAGSSASSPGDVMMAQLIGIDIPEQPIFTVGLASKAFIVDGQIFFWTAYDTQYQPTYFLVNGGGTFDLPLIVAKLAYQNGGGYLALGLPNVSIVDGVCYFPYLFKDLITAVNKNTNVPTGTQVAGVYSQTGINLCRFIIGTDNIDTAEIGKSLLISGGFLWMYDGVNPTEQNFFIYPENVEAESQTDPGPTGDLDDMTDPTIIKSVSSLTGICVGMTITDVTSGSTIPPGTTVVAINTISNEITMSAPATASGTGDTLQFSGRMDEQKYFYQVIYEHTDNQGNIHRSAPSIPVTTTVGSGETSVVLNIPNLNLTYKGSNVNIVIYRWSVAQPIYYQVTSVSAPVINVVGEFFTTYVDIASDAEILGNAIIYTNGGVLENINGPASSIFTLFDNRFWLVDAEDRDLLWFSKQVIENVPVEMNDELTRFVAPTQGAQGSTGHVTALAPMDDKQIIYKPNAIYYMNGTGPDNTGSNNQYSEPIFVTSTVGCENQPSIVFQPTGLISQSEKGMWLLGRDLSTTYIGAPVEEFNESIVQSAVNVPETNQVRFTLNTGETLMYDYFYGQWGTFKGVPALSSCIYQAKHTFLNSFAAVYQETPGTYMDGSNPVLLGLTSAWFNLAGLQGYQRAYFFYLLGKYITPHKLFVTVAYDYNPAPVQSSLISPTNFAGAYGGPNPNPGDGEDAQDPLGQQSPLGGEGNVEQWRVFLNKQRCQSFQISIQEVFDGSFDLTPGEGLTLSGINLVYGVKKGFRPMAARHSIGGGQ